MKKIDLIEIRTPIKGIVWRIGNSQRETLKIGDIVYKNEEIANLEAMKMENPILAPCDAQIVEICVRPNQIVEEGQLLFVLQPIESLTPSEITKREEVSR